MKALTISQAARAAGVGVETLRFYERRNLILRPSKLPDGGFRRYPPETIERVRFIRQAQGLGFSLREIEELLSLRADPASDCGQVRERAVAKPRGRSAQDRRAPALPPRARRVDRRLSRPWSTACLLDHGGPGRRRRLRKLALTAA